MAFATWHDRTRGSVAVAGAILCFCIWSGSEAMAQAPEPEPAAYAEEKYPDRLDGTLSAEGDLEADEAPKTGHFRFPTSLRPWLEFKDAVNNATGITFGGSYGILWQNYQESLMGEENAVGGKFTMNFSKDLLFRGLPNALTFDIAVEARHPLGTDQPTVGRLLCGQHHRDGRHLGRVRPRNNPGVPPAEPARRTHPVYDRQDLRAELRQRLSVFR